MSKQALTRILNPQTIAVVGASGRENNLGHWLLKSIIKGGYAGKIYPVNPKGGEILGLEVFPDVASLPTPVDVAVLSIPASAVIPTVAVLGDKQAAGVVVVAGGFAEAGPEGQALQEELHEVAARSGVRLLGPNTIGFVSTRARLNATFSPEMGGSAPGTIGVVSQSGSVCETLYFRCLERGVGFSALISAGNEADLDLCDYLEYLLEDVDTSVIALYVEQIRRPKRFVELLRNRPNRKPVVMFRTGRTAFGKMAAASHTGAMAGNDAVMKAVCRQLDVVDTRSYDDLIDAAIAMSGGRFSKGRRLAIVTGPGAPGVAACDAAIEAGMEMAVLGRETSAGLAKVLPAVASWRNPVDLTGSGATNPDMVNKTLELVLGDDAVDGIIFILGALFATQGRDDLVGIINGQKKPVLAVAMASLTQNPDTRAMVEYLGQNGIPCFLSPERAVRAFALLAKAAT